MSLGHYVVRAMMAEAAGRSIWTRPAVVVGLRADSAVPVAGVPQRRRVSLAQWYQGLLWEMRQEQIEPRRNRVNPRVVKVKMSKFPKKRPNTAAYVPCSISL